MNPDNNANAINQYKQSQEYIKAKNVEIRRKNRDIRMRNFLRKHK